MDKCEEKKAGKRKPASLADKDGVKLPVDTKRRGGIASVWLDAWFRRPPSPQTVAGLYQHVRAAFQKMNIQGFADSVIELFRSEPEFTTRVVLPTLYQQFIGFGSLTLAFDLYRLNIGSKRDAPGTLFARVVARMMVARLRVGENHPPSSLIPDSSLNIVLGKKSADGNRPRVFEPTEQEWTQICPLSGIPRQTAAPPPPATGAPAMAKHGNSATAAAAASCAWDRLLAAATLEGLRPHVNPLLFLEKLDERASVAAKAQLSERLPTPFQMMLDDSKQSWARTLHLFWKTMRSWLVEDIGERYLSIFYMLGADADFSRIISFGTLSCQMTDLDTVTDEYRRAYDGLCKRLSAAGIGSASVPLQIQTESMWWQEWGLPLHKELVVDADSWGRGDAARRWLAAMHTHSNTERKWKQPRKNQIDPVVRSMAGHIRQLDETAVRELMKLLAAENPQQMLDANGTISARVHDSCCAHWPIKALEEKWAASHHGVIFHEGTNLGGHSAKESEVWVGPFEFTHPKHSHSDSDTGKSQSNENESESEPASIIVVDGWKVNDHVLQLARELFRARKLVEWGLQLTPAQLFLERTSKDQKEGTIRSWICYDLECISPNPVGQRLDFTTFMPGPSCHAKVTEPGKALHYFLNNTEVRPSLLHLVRYVLAFTLLGVPNGMAACMWIKSQSIDSSVHRYRLFCNNLRSMRASSSYRASVTAVHKKKLALEGLLKTKLTNTSHNADHVRKIFRERGRPSAVVQEKDGAAETDGLDWEMASTLADAECLLFGRGVMTVTQGPLLRTWSELLIRNLCDCMASVEPNGSEWRNVADDLVPFWRAVEADSRPTFRPVLDLFRQTIPWLCPRLYEEKK